MVVAVVALVVLAEVSALRGLARETRAAVDQARLDTQALDLEAQVAWIVATGRPGPDAMTRPDDPGDAKLWIDGRPQAVNWAPGLEVAVQDEAGLVNLGILDRAGQAAFLREAGVKPDRVAIMLDRLDDYVDGDGLVRTDGAEAGDYARAGLAPPLNAPLDRIARLNGILGWREAIDLNAWSRLREAVVVDPTSAAVNINTAPAPALALEFGLTANQARAVIARRRERPFLSLEDLGRAVGRRMVGDSERVYGFPNGRFAVKVKSSTGRAAYHARIVLTPRDPERPFWIEERTLLVDTNHRETPARADTPFVPVASFETPDPGRPARAP
ncbi:general secretion pathway protein GspK [Caulobacter sp. Root655]|uniref:general secretion pathway protein GspK n=1 Tax=Caulobacter sp. Root655 TaxID=1736578 RepID=UPI001F183159|nr:type II secretion system protein GspK [Caulobacter sp. Root655]